MSLVVHEKLQCFEKNFESASEPFSGSSHSSLDGVAGSKTVPDGLQSCRDSRAQYEYILR